MSKKTLPVEIAPKRILPSGEVVPPQAKPPRFALITYEQDQRGNLIPKDMIWAEWVRVTKDELRKHGIGIDRLTLLRLGYNGYVRLRRVSPWATEVHLGSLRAHIRRVESDLGFWHRRSVPAGWTEEGEIIWEDSIVSRLSVFQTTDLPATCLGADRHLPVGTIKVVNKRANGGTAVFAHQQDLFGSGEKTD